MSKKSKQLIFLIICALCGVLGFLIGINVPIILPKISTGFFG